MELVDAAELLGIQMDDLQVGAAQTFKTSLISILLESKNEKL